MLHSQEAFDQVVGGGVRTDKGMVSFADRMTAEDSEAVRWFLVAQAINAQNATPPIGFGAPRKKRKIEDQLHTGHPDTAFSM